MRNQWAGMLRIIKFPGIPIMIIMLCIAAPSRVEAQFGAASATPFSVSSGRPSSITIKRNILRMKQAQIESELRVINNCIRDASQLQVLRDPQGNINLVPQTDRVNCARVLRTLTRRLQALARESSQLGRDAQFQANYLLRRAQQAEFARRTRPPGPSGN